MFKRVVYLLVFVLLLGAAFAVSQTLVTTNPDQKASQGSKSSAPKVLVESVRVESTASNFTAVSTGWADKSAEVYAVVDEKVTKVLFKPQQKVKRGQLLVQQDDREEQLVLRLAQVQLINTQSLLDRYKQAVEKGAVPQTQVDSAQAELDAAKVAVDQAQLAISNHQIRAPFDGVVGITDIDPGQRIAPGVLITGVDSREVMYVDFEVPEAIVGQLDASSMKQIEVKASTPAVPGRQFNAEVVALDSRLNVEKRTLRVRANISNAEDLLRPACRFPCKWPSKVNCFLPCPRSPCNGTGKVPMCGWFGTTRQTAKNVRVADRRQGRVFLVGNVREGETVVVKVVFGWLKVLLWNRSRTPFNEPCHRGFDRAGLEAPSADRGC